MKSLLAAFLVVLGAGAALQRCAAADGKLDAASEASNLQLPVQEKFPEQYIWTAGDAAALRPDHAKFNYRQRERKIEPHVFRDTFELKRVPAEATLYVAGPRSARVYLNGELVLDVAADPKSPLAMHVFQAGVHSALRAGKNVLAIEAVRGFGIVAASDLRAIQQLSFGEVLVAKIVPAAPGVSAAPLAITDGDWRSIATTPQGWQSPGFVDGSWPRVQTLGAVESSPEFFQWNLDAGLYDWPGYMGISSYLRTYNLRGSAVTHRAAKLENVETLTDGGAGKTFAVHIPAGTTASNAPALMLDFGREVAGRLLIASDCNCEARVLLSYGESEGEALSGENYLGTNLLRVPPYGVARGPKSGFRYAWLRFVGGAPQTAFRSVGLEGIAYPVRYQGSFMSSDPLLNRIWKTAAYTAHLCMQDGVWDAPKRDRGWWAGDLATSGPVISDVFDDHFLLDRTIAHLVPPANQDVNGIPGYTALWILTEADLYRHFGDKAALADKHDTLLRLLRQMNGEIDASGHFVNRHHSWLFVDWAPNLFAFTPEAEEGTELEFVLGYRKGAWLLEQMGDNAAAQQYDSRADSLAAEARKQYLGADGTFGDRWQLNAMAVLAGVALPQDYPAMWSRVFRDIGQNGTQTQTISPYFNEYLLEAMARMGHREAALNWMREYWGGMLAEGATSFWEAYDLRWPKTQPHLHLEADGTTGYFVSLAHGWSSGPASWLMTELLGVKAIDPGFTQVQIRPELADLKWMRGSMATPRGPVRVNVDQNHIEVNLPAGMQAIVLLPAGKWVRDGAAVHGETVEAGARLRTVVRGPGRYAFSRR